MYDLPTPNAAFAPETASERTETQRIARGPLIVQLVEDLRIKLSRVAAGTAQRALLTKLETLAHAVERWRAFPPTEEQSGAMLDMLLGLEEQSQTLTRR